MKGQVKQTVKEGSVIRVRGRFGNGPIVRGVVTSVEWDEDRNAMIIDYEVDGGGWWAYEHQIVEVLSY